MVWSSWPIFTPSIPLPSRPPASTNNLPLLGEDQPPSYTPLTTSYKWFTLLQRFQWKERRWTLKLLKTRLFLKLFSTSSFSKGCDLAEIWGVFIGLKRIQIWAPKFEFSLVPDASGATAYQWRCHRLSVSDTDSGLAVPLPSQAVPPPSARVLDGATAQPKRCHRPALGCWAVPPSSQAVSPPTVFSARLQCFQPLVGLQSWPKLVRTRAQLAPTWVIGLTPNPNPN